MTPVLVFDIETIPDVAGLRRLHDHPDAMSDAEVAEHAFSARREKTGSDTPIEDPCWQYSPPVNNAHLGVRVSVLCRPVVAAGRAPATSASPPTLT